MSVPPKMCDLVISPKYQPMFNLRGLKEDNQNELASFAHLPSHLNLLGNMELHEQSSLIIPATRSR